MAKGRGRRKKNIISAESMPLLVEKDRLQMSSLISEGLGFQDQYIATILSVLRLLLLNTGIIMSAPQSTILPHSSQTRFLSSLGVWLMYISCCVHSCPSLPYRLIQLSAMCCHLSWLWEQQWRKKASPDEAYCWLYVILQYQTLMKKLEK